MLEYSDIILKKNDHWIDYTPPPPPPPPPVYYVYTSGDFGSVSATPISGIPGTEVTLYNYPITGADFISYSVTGATLKDDNHFDIVDSDVYVHGNFTDPHHGIPEYTIRLKIASGVNLVESATQSDGTLRHTYPTLVDAEENIWDIKLESSNWSELYYWQMTDADTHSGVDSKRLYNFVLECLGSNSPNVTNMNSLFGGNDPSTTPKSAGCYNMTKCINLDISGTTSLYNTFAYCSKLGDDFYVDTSHITNFGYTFRNCNSMYEGPNIDTSSATNMIGMFKECTGLAYPRYYDTSNVTNMEAMFRGCTNLTSVPVYDTSNVTTMEYMFRDCTNITTLPLFNTANVTNMEWMMSGCNKLRSIPNYDVTSVTEARWICDDTWYVSDSSGYNMYLKLNRLNPVPEHYKAFAYCGYYNEIGRGYLDRIPYEWK